MIAIVTMDILGMDESLVWQTQHAVWRQAHIPAANLMLSASHNHSAPVTVDCGLDAERNRDWENQLVNTVAACVQQAASDLQPVTLAVGREAVQIGVNRRLATMGRTRMLPNPYGPIAPWVDVLRVDPVGAGTGQPIALLFSHAAHPVTVHSSATEFNADYPGYAVSTIREMMGSSIMPMFAQGCAGDINVVSLAGGLAEAQRLGRTLGEAAVRAAQHAQPIEVDAIQVINRETLLPFEPIQPDLLAALAERITEAQQAMETPEIDDRTRHNQALFLNWANRVQSAPPGLRFQVQGFAFDDQLLLVGMTHEPFVTYQLDIEARSPYPHTMVFGYTNGCNGYVPTAEAFYLGGYEVEGAAKVFGQPRLLPVCENMVKAVMTSVFDQRHFSPEK
jgi:hypothetical protein